MIGAFVRLTAAAAVLLVTVPGLAQPFTTIGPLQDSPGAHLDYQPAVAMDAAGNHAVVWTDTAPGTFATSIRLTDAAGLAAGLPIPASPVGTHFVTGAPAVAMAPTGAFAVAWCEVGSSFAVFLQRFDAAGVPQGSFQQASDPAHFVTGTPAVAMGSPSGDLVVVWTKVGSSPFAVYVQRFDAAGTPQGGVMQASAPGHFVTDPAAVGMDQTGNIVVAWCDVGSVFGIFFHRFDAAGASLGGVVQASDPARTVSDPPDLGLAPDGRFVLTWRDPVGGNAVGATFDASGNPVALPFVLNQSGYVATPDPGMMMEPEAAIGVSMDQGGNWVAAWVDSGFLHEYMARRFDHAGTPLGGEFQLRPGVFASADQAPRAASSGGGSEHAIAYVDDGAREAHHLYYRPPGPTCTITAPTPSALVSLAIDVVLDGGHPSALPVTCTFEYSTDSGATFHLATPSAASPTPNPLPGQPTPFAGLTFQWASATDGVGTSGPTLTIVQVTVDDGTVSSTCSVVLEVDNGATCTGMCGDCNESLSGPDILDALTVAQIAAGLIAATGTQPYCCDVDSSSTLTILDALGIARHAAGIAVTLSCP